MFYAQQLYTLRTTTWKWFSIFIFYCAGNIIFFIIKIISTLTLLYKVCIVIVYKTLPNSKTTYNHILTLERKKRKEKEKLKLLGKKKATQVFMGYFSYVLTLVNICHIKNYSFNMTYTNIDKHKQLRFAPFLGLYTNSKLT
jgi:hypothetical protein